MKQLRIVFVLLTLIGVSCKPRKSKKINFLEKTTIQYKDSLKAAFHAGKIFDPCIIRILPAPSKAFVLIDSPFTNQKFVDAVSREQYYLKVVAALPGADLAVLKRVWEIQEVSDLQATDGGEGAVMLHIKESPTKEKPYYEIELRKNGIESLPLNKNLTYVKIKPDGSHIEIASESEYFVSLQNWRKVKSR